MVEEEKQFILDSHEEEGLKLIDSDVVKTLDSSKGNKTSAHKLCLNFYANIIGTQTTKFELEIMDDTDIFYHYIFKLSMDEYPNYMQNNDLSVNDYQRFVEIVRQYIKESQTGSETSKMIVNHDPERDVLIMSIQQKRKFNFAEVIRFELVKPPKSFTKRCAQARYNIMRKELTNVSNTLENTRENVKARSVSLRRILDAKIAKDKGNK